MLDRISSPAAVDTRRPIVVFSRGLQPGAGGLEIFNANLVKALEKQRVVHTAAHRNGPRLADYWTRFWNTARLLSRHRSADLLVQYGSFLDILMLPLLRLFCSRVWVIAHVSDTWAHVRNRPLFLFTTLVLRLCARQLFVLADQQAAVFRSMRPIKVHTIIGEAFAATPQSSGMGDGFVFLGRVVAEKGIFDLVRAWGDPAIAGRGLKLRVYGAADEKTRSQLEAFIEAQDLGQLVTLEGPVRGDAAVIEVIDRAEALLYPTYADAFPLVMIESFARGRPCLVSAIGEGPSFVADGRLVVSPGDVTALRAAILRLVARRMEPEYLTDMRRKAARYASGQIVAELAQHGAIDLGDGR